MVGQFHKRFFKKTIIKKVMKDILFEVDVEYPEKLHEFHNDLLSISERIKIEKVEKLVANLHDKN